MCREVLQKLQHPALFKAQIFLLWQVESKHCESLPLKRNGHERSLE